MTATRAATSINPKANSFLVRIAPPTVVLFVIAPLLFSGEVCHRLVKT
jgi:hypothetical protein